MIDPEQTPGHTSYPGLDLKRAREWVSKINGAPNREAADRILNDNAHWYWASLGFLEAHHQALNAHDKQQEMIKKFFEFFIDGERKHKCVESDELQCDSCYIEQKDLITRAEEVLKSE